MNVRDIEETIHTLEARHPGLQEAMLITLLRAGGWEEKDIETAKVVFASSQPRVTISPEGGTLKESRVIQEAQTTDLLPGVPESPLFEPVADESHRLEEGIMEASVPSLLRVESQALEPVSLIAQKVDPDTPLKEDLPHNLPLRPFETSEHIWPFSRYRDVFYGEESSVPQASSLYDVHHVQNSDLRTRVVETRPVQPPAEVATRQPRQLPSEKPLVKAEKTGDEKLIVMACVMLIVILLLLGYMYSNGRL